MSASAAARIATSTASSGAWLRALRGFGGSMRSAGLDTIRSQRTACVSAECRFACIRRTVDSAIPLARHEL
jgi:hypothetical protein